jgi:hypothetical protein
MLLDFMPIRLLLAFQQVFNICLFVTIGFTFIYHVLLYIPLKSYTESIPVLFNQL